MATQTDNAGLSMAIWHTTTQNVAAPATFHFNLWHYIGGSFLDIGIMLYDPNLVDDIQIYLPVHLTRASITDLSPKLREPTIVIGVFNEALRPQVTPNNHIDIIRQNHPGIFCRVHCFTEAELTVSNQCGTAIVPGTIITIPKTTIQNACVHIQQPPHIYFRLRAVFNKTDNPFVSDISPKDRRLFSGYDTIRFVDFRLNEQRNLPEDVARRIEAPGNQKFDVRDVHLLLATEAESDFSGGYPFHKSRMLENNIWSEYVKNNNEPTQSSLPPHMVIYHCKKERGSNPTIEDFNAFLKFRIRTSNIKTILLYLGIFILLSYCTNNLPPLSNEKDTMGSYLKAVKEYLIKDIDNSKESIDTVPEATSSPNKTSGQK